MTLHDHSTPEESWRPRIDTLTLQTGLYCEFMAQEGWDKRLTRSVAAQVRWYRQQRKMSAQDLSDRCAELGLPIARPVLSNLENGRRESITLAELVVLARALDVAPVLLVAPVGREATVEILPGREATAFGAMLWFAGEAELVDDEYGSGEPSLLAEGLEEGANPAQIYRAYVREMHMQYARYAIFQESVKVAKSDNPRREEARRDAERAVDAMKQADESIRSLLVRCAELGIVPPAEMAAAVRKDGERESVEFVFTDVLSERRAGDE